jgi:hypothetical protein
VFQLLDISGTSGDVPVTLGGLDTVLNFTGLKYEGGTPAVAKSTGAALYGAKLTMSTPVPTADFDVAVNMGALNPLGAAITATTLSDGDYQGLGGATTSALAFNDTKNSGTSMVSVTAQGGANVTWFTIKIKAGTSSDFTTTLAPAPETLTVLPGTTPSGATISINYTLTLTAASPGEFIDVTKTQFNTASNFKYPVIDATVPSHTQVPSVNGVSRGVGTAAERGKIYGYMSGASLTPLVNAAGASDPWAVVKGMLKRKTTKVTGTYS